MLLRRETSIGIYIAEAISGHLNLALIRFRELAGISIGVAAGVRFVTKDSERLNRISITLIDADSISTTGRYFVQSSGECRLWLQVYRTSTTETRTGQI